MRTTAVALLLAATCGSMLAQNVPTNFVVDTLVSSGLTAPNDFCFTPDGRILIANRPGGVTVYANGSTATVGTVPNVETGSERALLGIAADPNFAQNGQIYVWYSSTQDAFMHLDRFTCTGDLANPSSTNLSFAASSRRVILDRAPDNAFNHNGGSPRFGPDGKLYLSIGDDASACSAQSLTTQQGVLLRMDVSQLPAGGSTTAPTFSALDPGDNPNSSATDFSQLVIANGLRNPVRMTIDPLTGNCYIGDVGQNAFEEFSEYVYNTSGLALVNFGWPWREGNATFTSCGGTAPTGLVPPLVDISSGQGWASIMGGPRYRNQNGAFDFGPAYEGSAFYSDYFAGQVRRLVFQNGSWSPAPAVPGQPNATNWGTGFVGMTSFDVGPDGAIYLVQHPSTYASSGGSLKRIRPLGPVNEVVLVSGDGQRGPAGEPFAQPVVVQVNDPQMNPLPGAQVNFAISGPGSLSTTNPVIADGQGRASTNVTALATTGGAITVTATTTGSPNGASASLFSRKITVTRAGNLVVLSVTNSSAAQPAQVPFVVMASAPGIPALPTFIGPICTDPWSPLTFVVEDSIGLFGFTSLSGSGATGSPGLTKVYNFPPGALVGVTLNFQAVGLDPVEGVFRTNCERKTL